VLSAIDAADIGGWIFATISAGCAAYFGSYLQTRGERKAIQKTLNEVERRAADISEAARERWSRRSEVCASVYGKLILARREFQFYMAGGSTDEAVESLTKRAQDFDEYFAANALFLPIEVKESLQEVNREFAGMFNVSTMMRPVIPVLEAGQTEPTNQVDIRRQHYGMKRKYAEALKDDGELGTKINQIENDLRVTLDLTDRVADNGE